MHGKCQKEINLRTIFVSTGRFRDSCSRSRTHNAEKHRKEGETPDRRGGLILAASWVIFLYPESSHRGYGVKPCEKIAFSI
jgi:hypothetical protein